MNVQDCLDAACRLERIARVIAAYLGAFYCLYKFFTDRPIIRVTFIDSVVDDEQDSHEITVSVNNAGKQDVTLIEVGFFLHGRATSCSLSDNDGPQKLPRRLYAGDEFSYAFRTGKGCSLDYDKIIRPFARLAGNVIVQGRRLKHW